MRREEEAWDEGDQESGRGQGVSSLPGILVAPMLFAQVGCLCLSLGLGVVMRKGNVRK